MSTLAEIVYSIKNISKEISDDSKLSFALLAKFVKNYRSVLIRRDYENKHKINPQITQSLGCWDLEKVDKSECCEIETDCYILRTTRELPAFVEAYDNNLISYIGSVDNESDFQTIPWPRNRWVKYNRYTKNQPFAAIKDNRLYIINNKYIKNIIIRGVLEDPEDASRYNECDGTPCYSNDSRFPMANWMEPAIIDMLKKNELAIYFTALQDKTNDGNYKKEPTQTNQG